MAYSQILKALCAFLNEYFSECCIASLYEENDFCKLHKNKNDFQCKTDNIFKNKKAYDLDRIKDNKIFIEFFKKYKKNNKIKTPKSADILIVFEESILLVEFKNPLIKEFKQIFKEIENKKNSILTRDYIEEKLQLIIIKSQLTNNYIKIVEDSLFILKIFLYNIFGNNINMEKFIHFIFLIDFSEEVDNFWQGKFLKRFKKHKTKNSEDNSYSLLEESKFRKVSIIAREQISRALNIEFEKKNFEFPIEVFYCSDFRNFISNRSDKIICP